MAESEIIGKFDSIRFVKMTLLLVGKVDKFIKESIMFGLNGVHIASFSVLFDSTRVVSCETRFTLPVG